MCCVVTLEWCVVDELAKMSEMYTPLLQYAVCVCAVRMDVVETTQCGWHFN